MHGATLCSENMTIRFMFFPQKWLFLECCGLGLGILNEWCGTTTLRNDVSDIVTHCIYGWFLGLDEMNDTCWKTTHTRIMDGCFTIVLSAKGFWLTSSPLWVNYIYYQLLIKFAIFHTHHWVFIKFMLLIINNNEIIIVWCQSEMFGTAAVTFPVMLLLWLAVNGTWLVILQIKLDESCSAWLWCMQLYLWCLSLLSDF
jgi:hypothetical protein